MKSCNRVVLISLIVFGTILFKYITCHLQLHGLTTLIDAFLNSFLFIIYDNATKDFKLSIFQQTVPTVILHMSRAYSEEEDLYWTFRTKWNFPNAKIHLTDSFASGSKWYSYFGYSSFGDTYDNENVTLIRPRQDYNIFVSL